MALRIILTLLYITSSFAAEIPKNDRNICDVDYNNTFKIQCLCDKDDENHVIQSADCYVTTDNIYPDDPAWKQFSILRNITKLSLSNARGKTLKYIPTKGLLKTHALAKIDVKYNNIQKIESYAFANLTELKEVYIKDNKIEVLEAKSFAHLKKLSKIVLDKNNIAEINRDVFVDLPNLKKLYLTTNMITTIHDRAFVNLNNLKLLEIDNNLLFSLNNETFSGLSNLEILDLSGNSLEVIGDNTFLPLKNLRSLNLEGNKIQMLDDKAFNGLGKLHSLTLANNKLTSMDSVAIFEALKELTSLSLRDNQLQELKAEVMAPILSNFYGANSSLDVEGNNFPCDCRLEWFTTLLNKTQNKNLVIALENLKCTPDDKVTLLYAKATEIEKSQAFEEEPNQNGDYEYYDDTQLNGKLFYIDLRILMNCTNDTAMQPMIKPTKDSSQENKRIGTESKVNTIFNNELLDSPARKDTVIESRNKIAKPTEVSVNKPYTTSRLATVSAKPIAEKKAYDEREMPADEAKPDALRDQTPEYMPGNAPRNFAGAAFTVVVVVSRLFF
ncbi:connectin-like [Leguminivora glycinivorella]|uniref:connectin-like n=1 Tax=Leguminivora glycinivorella TaxID=1035111 RepID=UPI00200D7067|nr:connectin-like [Leguminivora glycinivorella]